MADEKREEIRNLVARLGVEHCYLAPSDVNAARAILTEMLAKISTRD